MTAEQIDALAAWLIAALHRQDPVRFKLTGEQAAARLAALPHPAPAPEQTPAAAQAA